MHCPTAEQHHGHQISVNYSFLHNLPDPIIDSEQSKKTQNKDVRSSENSDDGVLEYVEQESQEARASIRRVVETV